MEVTAFMILFIGICLFVLAFFIVRNAAKHHHGGGGGNITPLNPVIPPEPPDPPKPPRNEYAFDRTGYVSLDRSRVKFIPTFLIRMDVKTKSESAFIFGLGYSIEFEPNVRCWIEKGRLHFYTYSGPNEHQIRLSSSNIVDDDKWHTIEINRNGNVWTMKIDSRIESTSNETPILTFPTTPLYIGNKPFIDSFHLDPFSGCIRNVTVGMDDTPPFILFGSVATHCAVNW